MGGAINSFALNSEGGSGFIDLGAKTRWILQGAGLIRCYEGGFGYVLDLLSYGADGFKRVDKAIKIQVSGATISA